MSSRLYYRHFDAVDETPSVLPLMVQIAAGTTFDTYLLRQSVGIASDEKKGFEPVPYIGAGRATYGAHNLHLTEEKVNAALFKPQDEVDEELPIGYETEREIPEVHEMKGRYIKMNLSDIRYLRQTLVAMTTDRWDDQRWKAMASIQEFCGYGLRSVQVALDRLLATVRDKKFKRVYNLFLKNRNFFDYLRGAKVAAFNKDFESCQWFAVSGPGGDTSSTVALDGMKQHVFEGTRTSFNRVSTNRPGKFRSISNPISDKTFDPPIGKRAFLDQLDSCLSFYSDDDPEKEFRKEWRKELGKWISDVDGELMKNHIRSLKQKKGNSESLESIHKTQADVLLTDPKFEAWRYDSYRPVKFTNNFSQLNLIFWQNLCIYTKDNAPFHVANDPELRVEEALRLEDSTMSAIYAWSATLEVLTNPGQFDKFLATRSSAITAQLQSVFRIFADFILDSVATSFRENPAVIPYLIDHMPNPANADFNLIKTVIRAPKWLHSREYFHNVKGGDSLFDFDMRSDVRNTSTFRDNQREFAERVREAGKELEEVG